jgi:hypothetical protein
VQAGFFHLWQEEKVSCRQIAVVSEFKNHAEADDKPNSTRHDPEFEVEDEVVSATQAMPRHQQHKYLKLYTVHENPQHRGVDVQTLG